MAPPHARTIWRFNAPRAPLRTCASTPEAFLSGIPLFVSAKPPSPAAEPTKPKVFVSYSWTNQAHTDRILEWCRRLVGDGVDVAIDRWSLSEGHDKYAYMERMVVDPTITHVLIFSDRAYAEKANDRAKGVGTESQIISAEIYGRTTQDKFLPIVCEFDANGEPCVPVFLKGRIHFNFSTPESANEQWERLIRRLYGKPEDTKPRLGKMPSYLEADSAPPRLTAGKFLALKSALQQGKPNLRYWAADYLDAVTEELEQFRFTLERATYEQAAAKIEGMLESMLPLRNELVEFMGLAIGSLPAADAAELIAELLERLLRFRYPPQMGVGHPEGAFDHFAFLGHELFIYAVAVHIRFRQFGGLAALLDRRYVVPETARGNTRAHDFSVFRSYSKILGHINQQANPSRLSVEADLIKKRASLASYPMGALMEADLLCALRVVTHPKEYSLWPPVTCVYAEYMGTLDLFLRAEERRVFRQLAPVIGVADKPELLDGMAKWESDYRDRFSWLFRYGDLSLEGLVGLSNLDTRGA